jgi:putative peptide zinc metalloprotease protein
MPTRDQNAGAGPHSLPFVMRADLEFQALRCRNSRQWTIKDAVAQRYWQLSEEEHFLLRSLDGCASADELCKAFAKEFPPRRLTEQRLTAFLARLHGEGLIVTNGAGQTATILERQRRWRRGAPWRVVSQVLAWRFRGIDPDRWLGVAAKHVGWLFTGWAAAIYVIFLLSALALTLVQWPSVDRELSALAAAFEPRQAVLFVVAIAGAKMLHELGHAIACKHFGGECHELGLMLFVGAPSLYCNVSDAWMLAEKRHRIVISAAGILVELGLAAACTWLWWLTEPGTVHGLALFVMVACSINTLLLNGNPLMQYDGYYVLADLTETPNLRQQASAAVRQLFARILLGVRIEADGLIRRSSRIWFVLYGIASMLYRWVVTIAILWFLHDLLEPYDLQILCWVAGALLLFTQLSAPVIDAVRFVRGLWLGRQMCWSLLAPRLALLCAALVGVFSLPLPLGVVAPVMLEPRGARSVYAEVEGQLEWAINPGSVVKQGDVLARLNNLALERELEKLAGERNSKRQRLEGLRRRQADQEAAAQIPTAEKSLADVEERLLQRQRDAQRLVIRAPAPGVVHPPPQRKAKERDNQTWVGTPLDEHNLGCHLQSGDVICVLGSLREMDGVVFVGQSDVDLVRAGQAVELFIDSFPNRKLAGSIALSPTTRAGSVPDELLLRGDLPIERNASGEARLHVAYYPARVELQASEGALMIGASGRARIEVAPRSIANWIWQQVGQTFRLP